MENGRLPPEDDNELDATVGGQSFRIRGRESIYLLITAIFAASVGVMLYNHAANVKMVIGEQTTTLGDQHAQLSAEFKRDHELINSSVRELRDAVDEQTYILTLTPTQRQELNMRMRLPPSLRRKMITEP